MCIWNYCIPDLHQANPKIFRTNSDSNTEQQWEEIEAPGDEIITKSN